MCECLGKLCQKKRERTKVWGFTNDLFYKLTDTSVKYNSSVYCSETDRPFDVCNVFLFLLDLFVHLFVIPLFLLASLLEEFKSFFWVWQAPILKKNHCQKWARKVRSTGTALISSVSLTHWNVTPIRVTAPTQPHFSTHPTNVSGMGGRIIDKDAKN